MDKHVFSEEPQQQADAAPATEVHLAEYWSVVLKRRRLVAVIVALVLAVTAVMTLLTRSTYKATTVVNVEKEKGSAVNLEQQTYQGYDPEFLPTQTRLMKSREVAERVAQRLNLTANPEFVPAKSGAVQDKSAVSPVIKAAMRVQQATEVVPIRGTNLVELSFVSSNPKLSADVANALAESYIDWNLEAKFKILGQANKFLATQAEQLKVEIDQLEKELQAYGRQKDIVSMDPNANVTMQNLESLNTEYSAAVADRVAKEAKYYEIQNARPDAIADTLSNGLVATLRGEQAKLEREYAEKLNLYKPEWPPMQQLKAQIDKGRQHLNSVIEETVAKARENARNEYFTARRREESLKGVMAGQKSAAMTQNTNAVEYNNLKVEIDTKKSLLDAVLKRQAETEISSRLRGERMSNIRVVDRAIVPAARFRPSYRRNAMLGLFLGLALGIGAAFFLEYLDRSLRSAAQVEQYLQLPTLGIIPAVGSLGTGYGYGYGRFAGKKKRALQAADDPNIELIPHKHPRSTVAEAYRAFRAALLLSRAGGVKSISVTSSLPGEGKTSTAANLAVVLGQIGKRVLVIDADLHKPRMHQVFGVSNRVGLVSVLAQNLDPLTAIQNTSMPNVWIMPTGPSTPNPSGLLSSQAMTDFLTDAKNNFDYVVVDTPPVGPVADAIVIGHATDGVILTTQAGRTPRELVRRVKDKLQLSGVRVLGILINNLHEDALAQDQYYKYYGEDYTSNAAAKAS
jgi:succinoglycan biosynthesis transport protein ExoP